MGMMRASELLLVLIECVMNCKKIVKMIRIKFK